MLLCRTVFLASWFKLCFQDLLPAVSLLLVCIWAITIGSFLALTKRMSRFLVVCAIFSTACIFSNKMFVHVFIYLVMILILLEMEIFSFLGSWRDAILLKTPISLCCMWYLLSDSWHSDGYYSSHSGALFGRWPPPGGEDQIQQMRSTWPTQGYLATVISICDIACRTELPLSAREARDGLYRYDKTHTVSKGWFGFILMSCLGAERLDLSIHSGKLHLT